MLRFLVRRVLIAGIVILIIYFAYALYVWFVPVALSQPVSIDIAPGQGSASILQQLADNHVIRNPLLARIYMMVRGKEGLVQTGHYTFTGQQSLASVVKILTETTTTPEVTLTFREGLSIAEMSSYLHDQGHPAWSQFEAAAQVVPKDKYAFLSDLPAGASLEGFLFPDTYRVFPDATATQIITSMLDNFDIKVTQDMRDDIAKQHRTLFDVVTLASIVEKEVPDDDDRAIVAGIFYKRIAEGMRLQSDATVNYITQKGLTQPSFDDLSADSPYNTYQHNGLPPGPIGNPSLSSIMAVIHYKATPYLYFLTTPDGKVIYSKTYEEHLANKQKYLSN